MSLTYSSVVDHPLKTVFAWHERPGAVHRLMPPWAPMRVRAEAGSLDGDAAVLALPLGVPWVARHRDYEPPHRFVDELESLPLRLLVPWRHTHEFAAAGDGTRVTDTVRTPVPGAFLRTMFAYRHRQLADDLAAHALAPDTGLTIAVTGSGGLVGSALVPFLTTGGHRVIRLVRREPAGPGERRWDPLDPAPDLLDGVDAVVHLAGASIAGRFTAAHKQAITESRIRPTARLSALAAASGVHTFVSASAIGFYGNDRGDVELTESSPHGDGFLADVVADWEAATRQAAEAGVRVAHIRTGLVQTPRGGVLRLLRPLFLAGLGGRLGDGHMWQSWIGIDDLVDVYHRALWDDAIAGPVNAVAPNPVRNKDYTRTLASVVHRPAVLPVPGIGPRVLLGTQGAEELAYASQRVVPGVLTGRGHRFRHPTLTEALRHVLGHEAPA